MDYSNLLGLGGKDNQGGTTQKAWFAPISYFQVIQAFNPAPQIPGSLEIITAHTFKPGKGFHEIYITLDTGKLTLEPTGERDGRGYQTKLEFWHPGAKKEAAAFARQCKNDQFIMIVESANGEKFQIGTQNLYAEIFAKFDSGTLSAGRNGWPFEVTSYANGLIFYDAVINEFPAVVV